MDKFRNTNNKAREIYELVENKLTEDEKVNFNQLLNNLIHATVLDVTNAQEKVTDSLKEQSLKLYQYTAG